MAHEQKQLSFLGSDPEIVQPKRCEVPSQLVLKIFIDGAARNNPGPSGSGMSFIKDEQIIFEQGFSIGTRTNNQAEYFALMIAGFFVPEYVKKHDKVVIYSDSQLLVRQMNGQYKIRDPLLQKMHAIVLELFQDYQVLFCHVYREHNVRADLMANQGIDKKVPLPQKFISFIKSRGVC